MAKAATLPDQDEEIELDHDGERIEGADEILQQLDGSDSLSQAGYPISRDRGAIKQSADSAAMSATFVIVTRTKDPNLHGNQVQIMNGPNGGGLLTENYAANPVVLFDHGCALALPIGTSQRGGKLSLTLQKSKAVATCFFSQSLPDAAVIYGLIDEDILRAASIQYLPTKAMRLARKADAAPEGVEDCRWLGWDWCESILMEWSIVALGADAGSLRKTIERQSLNGYRMGPALRQSLSQYAEKPKNFGIGVTLPGKVQTIPVPEEANPLFDGGELRTFVRDAVAQALAEHLDKLLLPAAALPVDTPNEPVTTIAQQAPAVTSDQIAQAYREQASGSLVTDELSRRLPGLIRQEVEKAAQPIIDQQRTLNERITQLTGRA